MADEKVTVIARARARAGLEEQVRQEIMALMAPTRAEAGCINYDLHQSADDPALFMLYENWVSLKDLEEHLAMPYLEAFKAKAPEILAEPIDITLWKMI
ncbi:MAG: antibiotic biosynthesis monooxygenase [Desulfuromonadales bacterium]|nr:MAG: antibiotic biosynthesis monooxygenase [Desulfuromonadales bacterium]